MSVVLVAAALIWMILAPTFQSVGLGVFLLVVLGAVWFQMWTSRRLRGRAPNQIVATTEEISSTTFALEWNRVARMWIGQTPNHLPAILIEPFRPDDIRRPDSAALAATGYLHQFFRWMVTPTMPERIIILASSIDRPLETLLVQLQEKAGHSLQLSRVRAGD